MASSRIDRARRDWLKFGGALLAGLSGACASIARPRSPARVVVVGGGYGGATAATYLARGGDGVDVTLVEQNEAFVSCPLSNLVIGGSRSLRDVTVPYGAMGTRGVRVIRDRATGIDAAARVVRLAAGRELRYDRLILSPGIDFFFDRIEGLPSEDARERFLHAWKAGPQTLALRQRVEAMPDGGVFAISIPRAPFRCPPAPYERACQVASYFRRAKPRSKVLILDGNSEVQSKKALFMRAWAEEYRGIVEYRPDSVLTGVDAATGTARFEVADDERPDVLNVIPPHGAGSIARAAGAITANDQWCEVDFRTFESIKVPNVHVLGDSIQIAPAMPKSGDMASAHGRLAAAAVLALLRGRPLEPGDIRTICYSFLTDRAAVHLSSLHRYDAAQKTYLPVADALDLSTAMSDADGDAAFAWANAIWRDMLG
jgi:NADPH-dependent 2,4-dienoyl-CoA reductase/sulfur reductase-like enzyme